MKKSPFEIAFEAFKDFNSHPSDENKKSYKLFRRIYFIQVDTRIEDEKKKLKEYKKCDNQARVLEAEILLKELYKERDEHMQLLTDL